MLWRRYIIRKGLFSDVPGVYTVDIQLMMEQPVEQWKHPKEEVHGPTTSIPDAHPGHRQPPLQRRPAS
jgi:hypothetical protein